MTHAVVWIDHQEARIFHVHPEMADESTVLSPQHHIHRHPKGRANPASTPAMRGASFMTSRANSMASIRS
jgi:hypothetical protein